MTQALSDILYKSRLLERRAAPELYAVADRFAREIGYSKEIKLAMAPHAMPNALAAPGKNLIVITEGMLKRYNSMPGGDKVAKEIQVILAHELTHLNDAALVRMRSVPLLAFPLAAMAAMGLYLHASAKAEVQHAAPGDKEIGAQLPAVADQAREDIAHKHADWKCGLGHVLVDYGMVLAAGALGLGGGMAASRAISLELEHRANRNAAKLVDPQTVLKFFDDTYGSMRRAAKEQKMQFYTTEPSLAEAASAFWKRLTGVAKAIYKQEKMLFWDFNTAHAHPDGTMIARDLRANGFRELTPQSAANATSLPGLSVSL